MPAKTSNTDPRVDAYIKKAAGFAHPILEHLRSLIHKGCPGVKETIKWSFPVFEYEGGILCNMAAFKQHCSFGFWKASLMADPEKILKMREEKTGMGHFDRITSLKDLPSDKILLAYIKEAARLNEEGVKVSRPKPAGPVKELPVPPALLAALKKNKKAQTAFEAFPPSHRKEYIQWITEAKTEPTRDKRIATTLEWLEEGKSRNWKYAR